MTQNELNKIMKTCSAFIFVFICFVGLSHAVFAQESTNEVKPFSPKGYFIVRQDLRRCASPRCGGVFVAPVNRGSMRCSDGSFARQCYVGKADYSALGFNPFVAATRSSFATELLVRGKIKSGRVPQGADFKMLVVTEALENVGKSSNVGRFWGLKDAGVRCITRPCYSGLGILLNSDFKRSFSGYDLSRAGLSKRDSERANAMIAAGNTLIARAIRRSYSGPAGRGTRFIATEVYLPVQNKKAAEAPL